MYKYNFETREMLDIFKDVDIVVSNLGTLTKLLISKCPIEETTVVPLFDDFFVGYPAKYMPELAIGAHDHYSGGYFIMNSHKIYFSIHGRVLYIRKTTNA